MAGADAGKAGDLSGLSCWLELCSEAETKVICWSGGVDGVGVYVKIGELGMIPLENEDISRSEKGHRIARHCWSGYSEQLSSSPSLSSKLGEEEFIKSWGFLDRLTERPWVQEVVDIKKKKIAEAMGHGTQAEWKKKWLTEGLIHGAKGESQ